LPVPKSDIRALEQIQQQFTRRQVGRGNVSEDRIAFQFREREQWAEALDDDLKQVAKNAVGVRELYARQVGGVTRDVREDEVAMLRGGFDACILADNIHRRVPECA
jgi:hypothetical protein